MKQLVEIYLSCFDTVSNRRILLQDTRGLGPLLTADSRHHGAEDIIDPYTSKPETSFHSIYIYIYPRL